MTPGILDRLVGRAEGAPLTPRQIAGLYLLFGLSMLVVSDLLLPLWLSGPTLREIQGFKGLVEVVASAVLIYVLVAAAQRQLRLKDRAMDEAPIGITIADARRADNPLVYANAGFESITGYDEGECLGRNMRFLQGENTDRETVERIRAAVEDDRSVEVDVRNYRADGTPFWNRLSVVPVADRSGRVTHYLGLQRDVTASKERKQRLAVLNRVLRHNVRNKLNVIRGRTEQLEAANRLPSERTERAVTGSAGHRPADAAGDPTDAAGDPADAADDSATGTAGTAEATEAGQAIRDASDELLTIADQIRAFDTGLDDERDCHGVDLAALFGNLAATVRERHPDATVDVDAPATVRVSVHGTFEPAVESLLELLADTEGSAVSVRLRDEEDFVVEIRDRGGALTPADLHVVAHGTETPLEHTLGLELWLVRWATEQSRGEFGVLTGDAPGVRLRFTRVATDPS
jgi:PAS domain S-box-containing protein